MIDKFFKKTTSKQQNNYYLVGDISGTHSNLAIIDTNNIDEILKQKIYKTNDFKNLENIIDNFLKHFNLDIENKKIKKCILSIAGNVTNFDNNKNDNKNNSNNSNNNIIKLTNSKLIINIKKLKQEFLFEKIIFINDFIAIASKINTIKKKDLKIINKGKPIPNSNKIIVGAGTGLGFASLIFNKTTNSYIIKSSEAGHTDFIVENEEELKLSNFIKKKYSKTTIEKEDLISGRGIEDIYEFLTNKKLSAKEISKKQLINKNAKKTMQLFFKFYARIIKNYALSELAYSGIYIAGGIVIKNQKFSKKKFMEEFTKNQTYSILLKNIPIYLIKDYNVSLYGIIEYIKNNNI